MVMFIVYVSQTSAAGWPLSSVAVRLGNTMSMVPLMVGLSGGISALTSCAARAVHGAIRHNTASNSTVCITLRFMTLSLVGLGLTYDRHGMCRCERCWGIGGETAQGDAERIEGTKHGIADNHGCNEQVGQAENVLPIGDGAEQERRPRDRSQHRAKCIGEKHRGGDVAGLDKLEHHGGECEHHEDDAPPGLGRHVDTSLLEQAPYQHQYKRGRQQNESADNVSQHNRMAPCWCGMLRESRMGVK